MTEVKPGKPKTKPNQAWVDALQIYQAEIEERQDLDVELTRFKGNCVDEDWLTINKACLIVRRSIAKMIAFHDRMQKKNEQ